MEWKNPWNKSKASFLDLCTDYSLHIKPVWSESEVNLYEKVVNFRTLSPPLNNITKDLSTSSVSMTDVQNVVVRSNMNEMKLFLLCSWQPCGIVVYLDLKTPSCSIRWESVTCAGQYKLYAKYQDFQHTNIEQRDWELIGVTSKNYYHHTTLACTEYRCRNGHGVWF